MCSLSSARALSSVHWEPKGDRGAAQCALVYSFGFGAYAQLGHGSQAKQPTPQVIKALKGVKVRTFAAGHNHSLAVSSAGEVYSFGDGYSHSGQLGHGDDTYQLTPKVIEALAGVKVRAVAGGDYHSLVLNEEGVVYSFGNAWHGELGHGDEEDQHTPKVIDRGASGRQGELHRGGGEHEPGGGGERCGVYDWGYGDDDWLGLGLTEHQLTPMRHGIPS
eukprot:1315798-Prymnesium_polylepis.2